MGGELTISGPFTQLTLGLAVGLRDSRGIRSLGKTPQRAIANEEACQLPAGKRVVPQQALALHTLTDPSLPGVISVSALLAKMKAILFIWFLFCKLWDIFECIVWKKRVLLWKYM
ncbi:hypothetical protein N780_14275 [Pontibacillus chungwhensis BH030062]|uniref:Uncharacterized protein n=1 Tax=Pontibacillus chungwhensis BH030062 TaxID=1385513 RepID=A0A0A2UWS4_9BACI|nr:hypothetical protein N780_14275 [Pontibacillus chungwhensis BH030062]